MGISRLEQLPDPQTLSWRQRNCSEFCGKILHRLGFSSRPKLGWDLLISDGPNFGGSVAQSGQASAAFSGVLSICPNFEYACRSHERPNTISFKFQPRLCSSMGPGSPSFGSPVVTAQNHPSLCHGKATSTHCVVDITSFPERCQGRIWSLQLLSLTS